MYEVIVKIPDSSLPIGCLFPVPIEIGELIDNTGFHLSHNRKIGEIVILDNSWKTARSVIIKLPEPMHRLFPRYTFHNKPNGLMVKSTMSENELVMFKLANNIFSKEHVTVKHCGEK